MRVDDFERQADIARVRRTATGILGFLFAVFLTTFIPEEPATWVRFVRAMAEAGMVGGIADWFAVEALFRRPLGLPIPHTALLPNNQKRAADNIARFVDENFLLPERLLGEVRAMRPTARLAGWLRDPANARTIGGELSGFLHLILRSQLQTGLGDKAGRFLSRSILTSMEAGSLADQIAKVLKGSIHGDVLDQVLLRVRTVLDGNRGMVTQLVQDRSRWWIASTVDDRIVTLLVDGMLSVVDELSEDNSDLRKDFEASVANIIDDLHADGVIASYLERGLDEFASSAEYQAFLGEMIDSVLRGLERDMSDNPGRFADTLARAISGFAMHVESSPDLIEDLENRLMKALDALLVEMRPVAVRYISNTIATWDSDELVARMELEVGRDLQFIRINGSVLGAFVGGTIFVITHVIFNAS